MRVIPVLILASAVLAGCATESEPVVTTPPSTTLPPLPPVISVAPVAVMTFTESVVTPAVSFFNDLYEPTMEVCDSGAIYITGHTILVDTTGAPVWGSRDDGATWFQLPFLGPASIPPPVHGATPPPSDEIFLSCGDDGWLYGVDITLATYPVNAWSGDGSALSYHNPNAYDETQAAQTERCTPVPAKDRPWGAYANGTLLMISNPGGGPAQIGVMQVPPALPFEPSGALSTQWNLCAGPGGSIPGIGDIRADGLFAVPQRSGGALHLVLGQKTAILDTSIVEVFPHTSGGEITSVYGVAAFDREGTLFVGISNNTDPDASGDQMGQMLFASSIDGGATFVNRTIQTGPGALRHFYMDPNDAGPGALVVWAVDGSSDGAYDWYVGHLQLGHDGAPVLENVALALDEGPQPSAHVTGAAVGPDGRAYFAMYVGGIAGGTPLSVYIQQDGPTLPVTAVAGPA